MEIEHMVSKKHVHPESKKDAAVLKMTNVLKGTNALNLVAGMNDRRRTTLRAHEHNIHELGRRGHGLHAFKAVNRHLFGCG
jgi:hypothetical protein